ncbi:hypothetical protein [Pseudomonas sp. Q1-7]|uniref:hypothetical protein n=1 Tax=Pseudomonas sp. Q1-7 TaxID=3020843 RepID=UPI0022FFD8AF|nr:hypothetical protein [Pseudomonas sp. Q1-7]
MRQLLVGWARRIPVGANSFAMGREAALCDALRQTFGPLGEWIRPYKSGWIDYSRVKSAQQFNMYEPVSFVFDHRTQGRLSN